MDRLTVPLVNPKIQELRKFVDSTEALIRQLKSHDPNYRDDGVTVTLVLKKLPPDMLVTLEQGRDDQELWKMTELRKAMERYVRARERASWYDTKAQIPSAGGGRGEGPKHDSPSENGDKQSPSGNPGRHNRPKFPCVFCQDIEHWSSECKKYVSHSARVVRMKEMKKCTLCLREGHLSVTDGKCNPNLLLKKCWICKEPGKPHQALCPGGGVGQKPKEKEEKEEIKVPSLSAVSSLENPESSVEEKPETYSETPQWLPKTENEWPEDTIPEVTPETEELFKAEYRASEIKAVMLSAVPEWSQLPWERVKSVDFATRVQARALRFIVRVRKESLNEGDLFKSIRANMELSGRITAGETTAARQSLVYIEQQKQYPDLPRGSWKTGRIVDIKETEDGQPNSAKLRLPNGFLINRPLNLLYPLDCGVGTALWCRNPLG